MTLSYTQTTWQDRVSGNPGQFSSTGSVPGNVTLTLNDNPTQAGTQVTAARMNNIENGVAAVTNEVNSHEANHSNPHQVTLAQVGGAPAGYGLGVPLSGVTINDSNSATTTGMYYASQSDPNRPSGVTDGALFVMAYSSTWVNQLYMDWRNNGVAYTRSCNNGTWGVWAKVGGSKNTQVYRTPGTYTFTTGPNVTQVIVTACAGGGGGGAGYAGYNGTNGSAGGVTSFGSLLSLSGGSGGTAGNGGAGAAGGAGAGGGAGGGGIANYGSPSGFGGGGLFPATPGSESGAAGANGAYGSGGSGGGSSGSGYSSGGGGGAGDFVIDYPISVTPNTGYTITIGAGGTGGTTGIHAGNGGGGYMLIEWWA